MQDYETMYTTLFNAITDALPLLGKCDNLQAQEILKTAQQETEEMYMKDERKSSRPSSKNKPRPTSLSYRFVFEDERPAARLVCLM